MEATVFTSSQISHELIRRRPPATARNTHRSTYQTYGLGFIGGTFTFTTNLH